jgi:Ca2+-binding EF-hand superfamily protein
MYIFLTLSTSLPWAKLRELMMASTTSMATTTRDRPGFHSATMAELPTEFKAQLKERFDEADANGNGYIDAAEMKALCSKMGVEASEEEIAAELAKFDMDEDGTISFDEMCLVTANLRPGLVVRSRDSQM